MARQHGGTDLTHGTCWQRVGKDRPCRQNLPTKLCVGNMSATFPTKLVGGAEGRNTWCREASLVHQLVGGADGRKTCEELRMVCHLVRGGEGRNLCEELRMVCKEASLVST